MNSQTQAAFVQTMSSSQQSGFNFFHELLGQADIHINGQRPWDMQVHNPNLFQRLLAKGSLGLGESYMDGWWDCEQLDEFFVRILRAKLHHKVRGKSAFWLALKAQIYNCQSEARAWQVGEQHYDLGNDLFEKMLDPYMAYSCGYWANSNNLVEAQKAKLDLICQKLHLEPGMKVLDIGCGWGSFMRYASEHYGVECVGLTISKEQAAYGQKLAGFLPIEFNLTDYRQFNRSGELQFDRIVSIGMFEHVGYKNYQDYFNVASRSIKHDGLFLLHTIGKRRKSPGVDPWIEKYIFPNGVVPSLSHLTEKAEEGFVIEDVHNFGADYDTTLMAWYQRFEQAWGSLKPNYSERFYRMWRYYLLCCAGSFRARENQLWQLVLSPQGLTGGYRRPKV
jgi:cyclopropane-fatty-acyl-phospholipid synthase